MEVYTNFPGNVYCIWNYVIPLKKKKPVLPVHVETNRLQPVYLPFEIIRFVSELFFSHSV